MGSIILNQLNSANTLRIPVKQVVIHPNYQESRYWSWIGRENNVALLKLAKKIKYTAHVSPVCLASTLTEVRAGSYCWLTGWGQTIIPKPGRDGKEITPWDEGTALFSCLGLHWS